MQHDVVVARLGVRDLDRFIVAGASETPIPFEQGGEFGATDVEVAVTGATGSLDSERSLSDRYGKHKIGNGTRSAGAARQGNIVGKGGGWNRLGREADLRTVAGAGGVDRIGADEIGGARIQTTESDAETPHATARCHSCPRNEGWIRFGGVDDSPFGRCGTSVADHIAAGGGCRRGDAAGGRGRQGGDHLSSGRSSGDALRARVGNKHSAARTRRNAPRNGKSRGRADAVLVARMVREAPDGGDLSFGRYHADRVVHVIRDEDITHTIHCHSLRVLKSSNSDRAIFATPLPRDAGECGDHAARRHLANEVVGRIRDVDVSIAIHRHSIRSVKPRRAAGAVGRARDPGRTRQGGDEPPGGYLAEGVIVRVRDVDVAVAIHRHAFRQVETRGGAGAVGGAGVPG